MSRFVTWKPVDHKKKVIEVEVRIDVILDKHSPMPLSKNLLPKLMREAEERWSKGQKYKCYEFRLKIDWQIVPDRASVRPDAMDMLVWDHLAYGQVPVEAADDDKALSEDPEDALVPKRGTDDKPGHFSLSTSSIAHEVGHILGLEDGYETSFWTGERGPRSGHPADVMQSPELPVLPSTIQRAVRRHYGKGIDSTLKCPITLNMGPAQFGMFLVSLEDIRLEALAERYDPPTDDPEARPEPTRFKGSFHVLGKHLTEFPQLPWSAQGEATRPVKFELDLGADPIELEIDLEFWRLTTTVKWDEHQNLPYPDGPFLIHVKDATIDSSMMWPGPPLLAEFRHGRPGQA